MDMLKLPQQAQQWAYFRPADPCSPDAEYQQQEAQEAYGEALYADWTAKQAAETMALFTMAPGDEEAERSVIAAIVEKLRAAVAVDAAAGRATLMGFTAPCPPGLAPEAVPFPAPAFYWWWRTGHYRALWPFVFRPDVAGRLSEEYAPQEVRDALGRPEAAPASGPAPVLGNDPRLARVAAWLDTEGAAYNARFAALVGFLAECENKGLSLSRKGWKRGGRSSDNATAFAVAGEHLQAAGVGRAATKDALDAGQWAVSGEDQKHLVSFLRDARTV